MSPEPSPEAVRRPAAATLRSERRVAWGVACGTALFVAVLGVSFVRMARRVRTAETRGPGLALRPRGPAAPEPPHWGPAREYIGYWALGRFFEASSCQEVQARLARDHCAGEWIARWGEGLNLEAWTDLLRIQPTLRRRHVGPDGLAWDRADVMAVSFVGWPTSPAYQVGCSPRADVAVGEVREVQRVDACAGRPPGDVAGIRYFRTPAGERTVQPMPRGSGQRPTEAQP